MRLAFITSSFPPYTSGVATNAATISSGLAASGRTVGVFIPDYDPVTVKQSPLVSPQLHIFSLPSINNPFKKSHRLLSLNHTALISSLTSFHPDVIHLQEPHFFLFPAIKKYSRENHIPLVCAHHFPPEFITNQLPKLLHLKLLNDLIVQSVVSIYKQSDLVITPTHAMAKLLTDHGLKVPVSVISNGVDTTKFTPSGHAGMRQIASQPDAGKRQAARSTFAHAEWPKILYLGRLDFDKNLDTLIHAAKFIKSDCEIWLAGGGKALSYLKSLAGSKDFPGAGLPAFLTQPCARERLHAGESKKSAVRTDQPSNPCSQPSIKFLGYIPENKKADIYRQATIFVMPSTAEAQSIVSLEAAACGIPLVLADAAALPELIDPTHPNGVLFTPKDPQGLAVAIDNLLSDPQKLLRMGHNSRRLAQSHDIKQVIGLYEKTYLQLIGNEN